jgi:hypothetical protein
MQDLFAFQYKSEMRNRRDYYGKSSDPATKAKE